MHAAGAQENWNVWAVVLVYLISSSMCVFLHVCIYVFMWRPEVDLSVIPQELSTLCVPLGLGAC